MSQKPRVTVLPLQRMPADRAGNRRPSRSGRALLALLPGLLMAQLALASGAYLDVVGEIQLSNSKTSDVGRKIVVHEDWIVGIQCTDRIKIVNHKSYWQAAKDHYWETLVQVDGKTIAIREGHIPQGKQLGTKYSGGALKSSASHFDKEIAWPHGMVFWKPAGQGLGMHEIRCVANHGGMLSDKTTTNNTAIALVEVVPAKAKPPTAEPPPATTPPPAKPVLRDYTTRPIPPREREVEPPARPDPPPTDTDGWLRAVGCHRPDPAVQAYVCTSREGLARCERFRQQGEVRSCEIRAGRAPRQ